MNMPLMCYRLPYVGIDLHLTSHHQTPAHTARPQIHGSVSHDVPVYSPSFCWVLIPTDGEMAQVE